MSFTFNWNSFNEENFYRKAKRLLTDALNKSNKPPIIVDRIVVQDLSLGDKPPNLEILEIGDLADDRFRGIFKLNYSGNASITLATKVQANLLNVYGNNAPEFTKPQFVGAASPLAMPLNLTLSEIKLSGIIILVYSKAKGLTLVFRNDPLEEIKVSSTFDALPGIARFLQVQIEKQIRILFREELPSILHKLSHKWAPGTASSAVGRAKAASEPPEESIKPKKTKPVSLTEINPDMPAFSAKNMLKLDTLLACQRTMSVFTPAIPEAVFRSTLDAFGRRQNQSNNTQAISAEEDYAEIMKIQSKSYARSSHKKPRRRVVKLNKNTNQTTQETACSTQCSEPLKPVVEEPLRSVVEKTEFSEPLRPETPQCSESSRSVVVEKKPIEPQEPQPLAPIVEEAPATKAWGEKIPRNPVFQDFFSSNAQFHDPPPYVA
ncbi:mitochondrial distribution and morphology protein 34 [Trichomonascus vanleenenianus]|uniref:ERMES complex subunit MDM34 n=1 Tax=Trichomonascus vanleenenianus TaxID=2268995 RepID=UPI003ECB541D